MKPGAMLLGAYVAVGVWVPAGCGGDAAVPLADGGASPSDTSREGAGVPPGPDGGAQETRAAAPEDAARAVDTLAGDFPRIDGGAGEGGRVQSETGDLVADATEAALESDAVQAPGSARDGPPDSAGTGDGTALADADDGSTKLADAPELRTSCDAAGACADADTDGEARPDHDATDAMAGGVSPDGGSGERIWVYILAGQSNMVGVGSRQKLSQEDATTVPGASIYYADPVGLNPQAGQWLPLGPGFGVTLDYFGPELAFARRLREQYPRRRLAILKVAEGGTGLFDRWRADTGDLYQLLLRETREQLGVLAADGRPQLAGLVWMQGESDASAQVRAETYQGNLTDFITALRRDLGSAWLPVVAGLIAKDYGWPFVDQVREATRGVAEQLGRVEVVETDDLRMNWDGTAHYDADGNLRLGRRFAEAMDTMQGTRWRFPEDFAQVQGDACFGYRDRTAAEVAALPYDPASGGWAAATGGAAIGPGRMTPAAGHGAELAFWAPFAGEVDVTLRATLPSAASAGVDIVAASPRGVLAGPAGLAFPTAIWLSFHAKVTQGDEIFFRTEPGPAPDPGFDTTSWQIDIAMTRVDE